MKAYIRFFLVILMCLAHSLNLFANDEDNSTPFLYTNVFKKFVHVSTIPAPQSLSRNHIDERPTIANNLRSHEEFIRARAERITSGMLQAQQRQVAAIKAEGDRLWKELEEQGKKTNASLKKLHETKVRTYEFTPVSKEDIRREFDEVCGLGRKQGKKLNSSNGEERTVEFERLNNCVQEKLDSGNHLKTSSIINSQIGFLINAKENKGDPLYAQLAQKYLTDEGLAKEYIIPGEKVENYKFHVPLVRQGFLTENGERIRSIMNSALIARSHVESEEEHKEAEVIMDRVFQADELFAKGDKVTYQRYLARSAAHLSYLTKTHLNIYTPVKLEEDASKYFDLPIEANTFGNYSVIKGANYLGQSLNKKFDPQALLHTELVLESAILHAEMQDYKKLDIDLDTLYAIGDFLSGASEGVVGAFWGTTKAVFDAALHPADTVYNLATSIVQAENAVYEAYAQGYLTSAKIRGFIYKTINEQRDNIRNMNAYERGELAGKIASEGMMLFLPGSVLKYKKAEFLSPEIASFLKDQSKAKVADIIDTISSTRPLLPKEEVLHYMGSNPARVIEKLGEERYNRVVGFLEQLPEAKLYLEKSGASHIERNGGINQILDHLLSENYIKNEQRFEKIEIDFNLAKGSISNIHDAKNADEFLGSLKNFDDFINQVKSLAIETKISAQDANKKYTLIQHPIIDKNSKSNSKYILIEYKNKFSTIYKQPEKKWTDLK